MQISEAGLPESLTTLAILEAGWPLINAAEAKMGVLIRLAVTPSAGLSDTHMPYDIQSLRLLLVFFNMLLIQNVSSCKGDYT